MSEIMTFLEIADAENRKNPILGINNVDSKPEPNVQKKIIYHFPIIYTFSGGLFKNDVFLKTFYLGFFQILVAQSKPSPTTPCAHPTDRNSWRN